MRKSTAPIDLKDARFYNGEYIYSPIVWLVNEPLKYNDEGELARWLPLDSLANFGKVVRCLPDGSPPTPLDGYIAILKEKLSRWKDGDFLVCVGDQTLLVAAAMIVGNIADTKSKPRVLKWERRKDSYAPVVLNLAAGEEDDHSKPPIDLRKSAR